MLDRVRRILIPVKGISILLVMLLSLTACVLQSPVSTSPATQSSSKGLTARWAVQKEEVPPSLQEYLGFSMTFDSQRNREVLFCFERKSEINSISTTLWTYEPGKGWSDLSPSNSPTLHYTSFPISVRVIYDPQGDRLLLFSIGDPPGPPPQISEEPPPPPDESNIDPEHRRGGWVLVWSYAFQDRKWQYLPISEKPPGESDLRVVYDSKRDQVILLQVENSPDTPTPLETWAFDTRKNTWEKRKGMSAPSINEYMSALTYDSRTDEVLLVGRPDNYEGTTLQLWAYHMEGDFWEERQASHPPSSRHNFALAYDDTLDATILFGGTTWGADPWTKEEEIESQNLRIPWVYNSRLNGWKNIDNPSPLPIGEYQMVYDPFNHCEVLFVTSSKAFSTDKQSYILTLKIQPET